MTNEMKLITALCDALGFEVEEIYESRIPSGQIIVAHDYKLTKKVDDDLEVVRALANEFSKGKHEIMTMKYNGKSYTYNDVGVLEIANENNSRKV